MWLSWYQYWLGTAFWYSFGVASRFDASHHVPTKDLIAHYKVCPSRKTVLATNHSMDADGKEESVPAWRKCVPDSNPDMKGEVASTP